MIDLSRFPRLRLAHLPTPLEALETLSTHYGRRIFIKRDDCSGLCFGGNKVRKLEFVLADAVAKGADTIITWAGLQSNHVRQTAAACAKLNLRCHCVLANPVPGRSPEYARSGNVLLDRLHGAILHFVADENSATQERISFLEDEERRAGRNPYVLISGASNGLGALGYVACAAELLQQCEEQGITPSNIVLATGSAGTQAGLVAGLRLLNSQVAVTGVSVSEPSAVKCKKVRDILDQLADLLAVPPQIVPDHDIIVTDHFVGDGYGLPTRESEHALRLVAKAEGILLDPVYTAKAMAGLLSLLEAGAADREDVIFLHTGGTPALFAYERELSRARAA